MTHETGDKHVVGRSKEVPGETSFVVKKIFSSVLLLLSLRKSEIMTPLIILVFLESHGYNHGYNCGDMGTDKLLLR